jgi:hypothetical protein
MDYNQLALGIDSVVKKMDKRSLTCLLEVAKTASTIENPEFYLAYFAFLIAKHLPEEQTSRDHIEFFRRAIETLALEVDSALHLTVKACPLCGEFFLVPTGGRPTHYCSQNGSGNSEAK